MKTTKWMLYFKLMMDLAWQIQSKKTKGYIILATQIVNEVGLEINVNKSNNLILNSKETFFVTFYEWF